MEALVPAFIAVLLAECGGCSQREALALIGAGTPKTVAVALMLLVIGIAAGMGDALAHSMPQNGSRLMLGIALLAAGIPLFLRPRPTLSSGSTARLLLALAAAGGPFIVFAIAAQTGLGFYAGLGGVLAGAVATLPGLLAEQPLLPMPRIRRISAVLLSIFGLWAALAGLGLI
jgi:putative Ca2+/H+ antiporter (TMEM165/GDT1 family)